MIKTVREIDSYGGKLYYRECLDADIADLQANYKNVSAGSHRGNKFHSGDFVTTTDGGKEYKFEEGSNQWYLQA